VATKPITRVEPFTGEAAAALTEYLANTQVDPKKQEKVDKAIRENASRAVQG
jgi:hypothetical protein